MSQNGNIFGAVRKLFTEITGGFMQKEQIKSLLAKIVSSIIVILTIGFAVFALLLGFMYLI